MFWVVTLTQNSFCLTVDVVFAHNFQDGELTKEEIVEKHDVFVGSQATDFGEALTRHDEF